MTETHTQSAPRPAPPAGVRTTRQTIAEFEGADYARDVILGSRHTIPVTGVPRIDVMGDMVSEHLDPFVQLPFDEDGTINWVSYTLNIAQGVLSALGIVQDLIEHGLAALLLPFAQVMELPAAVLNGLHVGMPHGHAHPPSLIPPAPVPVPLPSLGTLMLSGAVTVQIAGTPAARAGDVGIAPTCGSTAPMFMVVTGSSSVFIAGGRAARMGDLTIHCNPILAAIVKMEAAAAVMGAVGGAIGVAAQAAGGNAMGAVAAGMQAAADVAADALRATVGMDPGVPPSVMGAIMLGEPTVLIGGLPLPPTDVLIGMFRGQLGAEDAEVRRHRHSTEEDPEHSRRSRGGHCRC